MLRKPYWENRKKTKTFWYFWWQNVLLHFGFVLKFLLGATTSPNGCNKGPMLEVILTVNRWCDLITCIYVTKRQYLP